MIDNVLYVSTPYNRVVALDAETRTRAVALRSEGVRRRAAAERHGLRASRRRGVARRRQAAHLPQQPLPPDSASTRRPASRSTSFGEHGVDRSERRPGLGDQQEALHQHVAAGRLQGPRHPRQRRRRSAHLPERSAGRRARVQRADRQAGVDVPHDSAAGRVRQRHLGRTSRGSSPATPTSGRR